MEWKQAILEILKQSSEPRHYADIAEEIAEKGYRGPNELGATPANTVSAVINTSLRADGDNSPFFKTAPAYYSLRGVQQTPTSEAADAISTDTGIINALGMYWHRSKVVWKTSPSLLGRQQQDADPVDFGDQIGVYFLHDNQGVVYVGRAIDQTLGRRLQQHTVDRLNSRWDRFSWFGIYPVLENGKLKTTIDLSRIGVDVVISTLEAVLIEGLEPRQNRQRGDNFKAVEFLQSEDPGIAKSRVQDVLRTISSQLDSQ